MVLALIPQVVLHWPTRASRAHVVGDAVLPYHVVLTRVREESALGSSLGHRLEFVLVLVLMLVLVARARARAGASACGTCLYLQTSGCP